ncbi:MAG TPA: hypothetical protein VNT30_02865 [Stellaceae bacterium]|nr:hypothetical protein [Stellaceae bacterium]
MDQDNNRVDRSISFAKAGVHDAAEPRPMLREPAWMPIFTGMTVVEIG